MQRFREKLKGVKPRDYFHILLFLLALPIALVYKLFRRDLWLICDNGAEASDNGYWLYEYIRREHPGQDCVFAVNRDSRDREKVERLGKTVAYGTFMHWILYLTAKVNISSQKGGKPNFAVCYLLEVYSIMHNKRVFLQHGVILTDIEFLYYENTKMDMFVTSTYREWDYVNSHYGYPEGVVKLLGLPRWDRLHDFNTVPNQILIMPTWRGWEYPQGERFYETPFYRHFQSLLDNPALLRLLEERDLKLVFYPHIELQNELDKFKSPSERIILAGWRDYDVQTLLMRCSLLITDYSSVFFDVGYMEKPVIYYQFDVEDFLKYHYQKGYFSYEEHGFGPVVQTEEALINAVYDCAGHDFRMQKEYRDRLDAFYPVRDELNCERTYQILRQMDGENGAKHRA